MAKSISAKEAAAMVPAGAQVMLGGFLSHGSPQGVIDELVARGVRGLTLILNDTGYPERGAGQLIHRGQARKVITSDISSNPDALAQMMSGLLEVEFSPQGTLVERIRCGGAGLGGVLTHTGVGTVIAEGKQRVVVDGTDYLLEKPLRADFAIIKGAAADRSGNIVYRGTAQNFNPIMALAADTVIAEVDELLEVGAIEPEHVHTPGLLVDYIVCS
ncbi:MAG: branched-chain amino acid dehydrogenase [Bacteroidia bacterium]|nr:MAG: branched-chain amino acid dehydrogenase [Bacteroidia bacterium]